MKILKSILLVIVVLIAIVLIAALFVKKEYSVEREIIINKPNEDVFNYVKHLKNQDKYNKWVMMDPNVRRNYSGTDGTVGFVSTWDSDNKNVGKGEQEIKKINEGERIDLDVRFEKPFKNTANVYMTTEAISANQTKVKWGMQGKNSYPLNLMNLFVPGILGKDLQTSLTTLKMVLEN
ncbi:MAG: SRPBCC family protein [Ginsengibacter sp.]